MKFLEDDDSSLYSNAVLSLYLITPLTIIPLLFTVAPYGKHIRSGWGPTIPSSLAWFLMESPTLWLTLLLYPHGRHSYHPLSLLSISLYFLHYFHRTIIYPSRQIKNKRSDFPISIALMAFMFNLLNAYIQTRSVSHYAIYEKKPTPFTWVRILVGLVIFGYGMGVNVKSDLVLLQLKEEGKGYRIPRGGWFELVCCPNYMGEILEWFGWAVVCWSPASFGFLMYTCANLVPRAKASLGWYREKFGEDYPRKRKAIVPFVF